MISKREKNLLITTGKAINCKITVGTQKTKSKGNLAIKVRKYTPISKLIIFYNLCSQITSAINDLSSNNHIALILNLKQTAGIIFKL